MTLRTNARIAGFAFLFYIAAGISSLALAGRPHVTGVLTIFTSFSALVLGVTLYAITREVDPDLALLALTCRVIEAMPGEGAIYFAVGSTIFCWLLLRGRMIPVALAWLGVFASLLLDVILLLQRGGLYSRLYEQQFQGGRVEAECEDGVVLASGEVLHTPVEQAS